VLINFGLLTLLFAISCNRAGTSGVDECTYENWYSTKKRNTVGKNHYRWGKMEYNRCVFQVETTFALCLMSDF
jgi:hypothetical protein